MDTPAMRPIRPGETIAVAIATKNRPSYLASLLTSLSAQTYENWVLVINDQSDPPVERDDAVRDLLQLIESRGHTVVLFHTDEPRDRYQRAMDAVPRDIDVIVRVDDDVILKPTYLEKLLRPFELLPDRPIAAIGGCLPEPHMKEPLLLEVRIAEPGWLPRVDRPTWRLQGHWYTSREILEVESLWGCSMCYRRSAVEAVGGWFVAGQSEQVYREDSDMSARLLAAGYDMLVTTEALGHHLVAPSGGSREYRKSPQGNVLISDRAPFESDDALFRTRLRSILANHRQRPQRRWSIDDLERGNVRGRSVSGLRQRIIAAGLTARRVLRSLRSRLTGARG